MSERIEKGDNTVVRRNSHFAAECKFCFAFCIEKILLALVWLIVFFLDQGDV